MRLVKYAVAEPELLPPYSELDMTFTTGMHAAQVRARQEQRAEARKDTLTIIALILLGYVLILTGIFILVMVMRWLGYR